MRGKNSYPRQEGKGQGGLNEKLCASNAHLPIRKKGGGEGTEGREINTRRFRTICIKKRGMRTVTSSNDAIEILDSWGQEGGAMS